MPIGGEGGRGGTAATDPVCRPTPGYSLGNLLGSGGRANVWFGGYDVQKALEADIARQPTRPSSAAIFDAPVHSRQAAAQLPPGRRGALPGRPLRGCSVAIPQEARRPGGGGAGLRLAGEIDRAVQLYRQLGDHASAGDVLRRAGEEEKAFAEYEIAAELLAAKEDYFAAAELMMTQAIRPTVAQTFLERGWARRPTGSSVACAFRLAQIHADCRAGDALVTLVGEGRALFDPPGNDGLAGKFYNTLADLAEGPGLAGVRDEVRDQTLLGLATKLRQRVAVEARSGGMVSSLFGSSGTWPAAMVSDAQFAALSPRSKRRRRSAGHAPRLRVSLSSGTVTAACAAAQTGEVFVGFANGEIMAFQPGTGAAVRLTAGDGQAIDRLSTSPKGEVVLALQLQLDPHSGVVASSCP